MTQPGGVLTIDVEVDGKKARRQLGGELAGAGKEAEGHGKASGHVFGLGFAAAAGVAIGRGLKTAAALEQTEVGLKTLTGSASAAQDMLGKLTGFARATPFEMQGLAENARALLGVGVAADDVIPTMQALGDASAAMGLSQAQLDSVMRAVTQSFAKGKVQQEELLQMAEAGLPIYGLMAEAVGASVPEMQAMATEGKLLADDTLPKLLAVMQRDYAGGMVAQSKTLNGVLSTVSDDINLGLAEAVESLLPLLTEFLPEASAGASGAIHALGDYIHAAAIIATPFVEVIGAISEGFGALPGPVQTSVVSMLLLGRIMGSGGLIKNLFTFAQNLFAARGQLAAGVRNADSFAGGLRNVGRTALGAAGRTGMGALASSLVGGAWGAAALGIGLVVTGLISIGNQAKNAGKRIEAMVGEIDYSNAASAAGAIGKLQDEIVSSQEYLAGFTGNGKDGDWFGNLFTSADNTIDEARDKIEELTEAQERYGDNSEDVAASLGLTVAQLEALANASGVDLNLLAGDREDVAKFRELLAGANAAVEAGFDPTSALGEAMAKYGDEAATAADRSDALRDALDALSGRTLGVQEATANWQEALAGVVESFQTTNKDGDTILDKLALASVNAAGALDLTSEAGRGVHDGLMSARDAALDTAQAAYDAGMATGGLAEAQRLMGEAVTKSRTDLQAQLVDMGLSEQQAAALVEQYGLVPEDVATAITTPGMTQAQLDLITIGGQLDELPPNTPLTVEALTTDAEEALTRMGIKVERTPKGVTITAETAEAELQLKHWMAQQRRITVDIVANGRHVYSNPATGAHNMGGPQAATGGLIVGPGTGTSDSIPAHLSDGEYVIKATQVARYGVDFFHALNAGALSPAIARARAQLAQGFANGGLVTAPAAAGEVTNVNTVINAAPTIPTEQQLAQVWRRGQLLAGGARRA